MGGLVHAASILEVSVDLDSRAGFGYRVAKEGEILALASLGLF